MLNIFLYFLLFPKIGFATCPVCIAGVGIGLGLSRYLGIDDIITGIWLGGFTLALTFWTINWLEKRNVKFKGMKLIVFLIFYASLLIPLYLTKVISQTLEFLVKDRLFIGILFGTIIFYLSVIFDQYLRKINHGKVLIYYQKVIIPILFLTISSLLAFILIKLNFI